MQIPVLVISESPSLGLVGLLVLGQGAGLLLLHDDYWVQREHRPVLCLY